MIANVILSLIPVLGILPSLVALVTNPSIFVKALSLIAIVGNLGDLLELIPGLQEIGAASFLGDAASSVMKVLFESANSAFRAVLDALELGEAFDVILDMLKVVGERLGSALGEGLEALINAIKDLFEGGAKLWESFVAFVQRVGTDLLLKMGFDEGSAFVGRMLRAGESLTDESILAADRLGDKLAEAGVELSDDAVKGTADAERILGESETEELFQGCLLGMWTRPAKLASMILGIKCDEFPETFGGLSEEAQKGFSKIPESKLKLFLESGLEEEQLEKIGQVANKFGKELTEDATDGLVKLVQNDLGEVAEQIATKYSDEVAENTFQLMNKVPEGTSMSAWSNDSVEGVSEYLTRKGNDPKLVDAIFEKTGRGKTGSDLFKRIKLSSDAKIDGLDRLLDKFQPNFPTGTQGYYHTFDYAEKLGFDNIASFEEEITAQGETRIYDIVTDDGRLYELKSIQEFGSKEASELNRDLTILNNNQLKEYRWVFRGERNQAIVDAFLATIETKDPALLQFINENNIIWFGKYPY
jgi:hypothetical protein